MSDDKYQSCPCGSGKKLKFCCYETHRTLCVSVQGYRTGSALRPCDRQQTCHPRAAARRKAEPRPNSSGRFLCRQISGSAILIADGETDPLFTIAVMPVMPMSVYAASAASASSVAKNFLSYGGSRRNLE